MTKPMRAPSNKTRVPVRVLSRVEALLRRVQGKGWGAATIEQEVESCLACSSKVREPVVLDVGANVGAWTHALRQRVPEATIIMVEPSAVNIDKLRTRYPTLAVNPANVQARGLHLLTVALSSSDGQQTLYADAPGSGLGSLTKRELNHHNIDHGRHTETVETTTLDTLVATLGLPNVDILKMDIEGHELGALLGGRHLFERRATAVVQFEFGGSNIDTRTYLRDFWEFFAKYGYDLYRMSPVGLIHLHRYDESLECFDCTNYLAVRTP